MGVIVLSEKGGGWEAAAVRYLWMIEPGGADEPERLYIGSEPDGLFLSEDRGESWTSLGSYFPPIYSVRFAQ